jgi:hypothetical protein
VRGLEVVPGTLEDVFLELTGRELRDERRSTDERNHPDGVGTTKQLLRSSEVITTMVVFPGRSW